MGTLLTITKLTMSMVLVMLIVNIAKIGCSAVEKHEAGEEPFPQNNCFSDSTIVLTKNATSSDTTARKVMASNVREGDLVRTLDASSSRYQSYKSMWTRATDVSVYLGNWTAHTFLFPNDYHLTVTSPHLMIVFKKEKSYFIRADQVRIGDLMLVNKKLVEVANVTDHLIERKVAIETEDGTLQVNGIWASGFCEDNADVKNILTEYHSAVDDYKLRHFGKDYFNMCMDEMSWKIAYMRNNRLSQ